MFEVTRLRRAGVRSATISSPDREGRRRCWRTTPRDAGDPHRPEGSREDTQRPRAL